MATTRTARLAAIGVGMAVLAGITATAWATNYCEDVSGELVIVGEARYATRSGDDESYANVYWGGNAHELNLDPYNILAGANSTSTTLNFGAQAHHEDDTTSDCTDITFTLQLQRSTTHEEGTPCPSGTITSSSYTYTVNSCVGGSDAHLVYAGRAFGGSSLSYKKYWRATLTVGAGVSDSGCFQLQNQNDCTLVNF